MTELENLKVKLFEIVECIGALENKPNEDVFTFTREQLLSYSKFIMDETVDNIQTCIKGENISDLIDEVIDLEMAYNREIFVNVDEKAIKHQINSIIEDSIGEDGVEYCVQDALEYTFPTTQD
jgi:predicted KAP-like P-loop ATPase